MGRSGFDRGDPDRDSVRVVDDPQVTSLIPACATGPEKKCEFSGTEVAGRDQAAIYQDRVASGSLDDVGFQVRDRVGDRLLQQAATSRHRRLKGVEDRADYYSA